MTSHAPQGTANWRRAILELFPDEASLEAKLAAAPDLPATEAHELVAFLHENREFLSDELTPNVGLDMARAAYWWAYKVPGITFGLLDKIIIYESSKKDREAIAMLPAEKRLEWVERLVQAHVACMDRFDAMTKFPINGDWRRAPHEPENRRAAIAYVAYLRASEEIDGVRRRIVKAASVTRERPRAPKAIRAVVNNSPAGERPTCARGHSRPRKHGRRIVSRSAGGGSSGRSTDDPEPSDAAIAAPARLVVV